MYHLNGFTAGVIVQGIVKGNCKELLNCVWSAIYLINYWLSITFDPFLLQIPTQSHNPTNYHPRFQPLWFPEIGLNPKTSDHKVHFPSSTLIQWIVILRNEALVSSAVEPSAINEIFLGAACWWIVRYHSLMFYMKLTNMSDFRSFNHFTNLLWI